MFCRKHLSGLTTSSMIYILDSTAKHSFLPEEGPLTTEIFLKAKQPKQRCPHQKAMFANG